MARDDREDTSTQAIARVDAAVAQAGKPPRRLSARGWALIAVAVAWGVLFAAFHGRGTVMLDPSQLTDLHSSLNSASSWVAQHRGDNPVLIALDGVRVAIDALTDLFLELIAKSSAGLGYPVIGWLGSTAVITWLAWLFAGWRPAVFSAAGLVFIGLQGLYLETMQTLALTLAAVLIALLIGLPVGVWMGLSRVATRVITPILDFMQTMPTFVYLAPLALIFLIGPASAVIATVMYSTPPVIRLTAHGVRSVPKSTDEAVASLGATGRQRLRTVVLPLARRSAVIGINQTIMAALSMVTIAALIAAPGLGDVVMKALQSLNVGRAFNGGVVIVILAIMLDRITTAASRRFEPEWIIANRQRQGSAVKAPKWRAWLRHGIAVAVVLVAIQLSRTQVWAAAFPSQATVGPGIEAGVNGFTDWVKTTFSVITTGFRDLTTMAVITPLQTFLEQSPVVLVIAVAVLIAAIAAGWWGALATGLAFLAILGLGVWSDTMVTLGETLVGAVLTMVLALLFGVWMGRSRRADAVLRPILDAAQVMPPFVYLVPFLGLFGPSRFTAILAAVIYAAPIAIKIIADGIRQVPAPMIEAGVAAGASPGQVIRGIQIPSARRSIALALNQGLIYVLAMVVIGGLVGGGGLGYLVVAGFVQGSLFGKGLAAGFTIVLLGVVLDRVTQSFAKRADPVAQRAGWREFAWSLVPWPRREPAAAA